jgi:hypothetical protein
MSGILHDVALGLGYLTLFSVFALLALFVLTLVVDAVKPWRKPKAVTVDRFGPFLSPHPHRTPVYRVQNATSEDAAWRALEKVS